MTEAHLSVQFAGPHVSIQDAGRPGFLRFGVPWSGPLDRRAFAAAHAALGNPPGAPAIEVSPGGLVLEALSGTVSFAVAGGGFHVDHAGQRRMSWTVATLQPGERLAIRPGPWGSWCYLAFAGTLSAATWLGSASTHALSGFGGGALRAGARLTVQGAERRDAREGDIPCPDLARPLARVRVTLGPQERFFSAAAREAFLAGPWRMTDAWDRMGVRIAGPSIAPEGPLDMPSEPILRGSVQVAGDGVASILLADHQTTGGYPKIATVLDCDTDRLAQLRPQDAVAFVPVTPDEAVRIARDTAAADASYLHDLARPRSTLEVRLRSENLIGGVVDAVAAARP